MWLIAHLFEWPMARFEVKSGHQKDTLYDEIGLCSQNIDTVILGSIVTAHLGWSCEFLEEKHNHHFDL